MNKTLVKHDEYKKILDEQISLFYKGSGLKSLTEIDEYMSQYDIIPFEPNTGNTDIDKLINTLCDEIRRDEEGLTVYKGFLMCSDSFKFYGYFKKYITLESIQGGNGYSNASYNREYKLILSWCEGDIFITVCNTEEKFKEELARTIKFFKEEF